MMLYVRRVPEHNEGNPGLRGGSVELCLRGGLLGMHLKSHKCLTSVRNGKTHEYISMDNIQFV